MLILKRAPICWSALARRDAKRRPGDATHRTSIFVTIVTAKSYLRPEDDGNRSA
jgi:hypothetical protein